MKKLLQLFAVVGFSLNAFSEIVEVTILQTTDIHAHISYKSGNKGHGDWLRLASLIKQQRRQAGGEKRCLLIDCGDTIQGTLIGAISRGQASITMLNTLKYDAWILGNHELDFGIPRLNELTKICKIPTINGNFKFLGSRVMPAYRIYEKSGAKIVVIGMNAFLLDYWSWGEKMEGFEVEKADVSVERVMPEILRLKPDMIILALHQGLAEKDKRNANEVKALSYRFPQIDLILGGHTHREFPGKKIANSWYAQAGKHGRFLAKVIATIDTDHHRVLNIESQLLTSFNHPQDATSSRLIQNWVTQTRSFASRRVCYVDREISSSGTPGYDCQMSEVICRAISSATESSVVFHGVLSKTSWTKDSYLTEETLFDTIPYENGIGIAQLTFSELTEVIEEQLKFKGTRSFNGIYGINAEINTMGSSISRIVISHQPILKAGERISVAFNSYTIAGGGGRFPTLRRILKRPTSNLVDFGVNSRDILRNYLKNSDQWKDPPISWFHFQNSKK